MKKGKGSFIKGCKERGEWAELCFMARAVQHGFSVSRPYGDSSAYGVGVEYAYTMVHHAPQSAQKPQIVPKKAESDGHGRGVTPVANPARL